MKLLPLKSLVLSICLALGVSIVAVSTECLAENKTGDIVDHYDGWFYPKGFSKTLPSGIVVMPTVKEKWEEAGSFASIRKFILSHMLVEYGEIARYSVVRCDVNLWFYFDRMSDDVVAIVYQQRFVYHGGKGKWQRVTSNKIAAGYDAKAYKGVHITCVPNGDDVIFSESRKKMQALRNTPKKTEE